MGKITGFKEYKRENPEKRDIKERIKDYREIYYRLPEDKLKIQAARCMNCGTPFCNWGCPTENIIPDWNDFVYRNNWEKAFERLTLTNSFPEFTGRVCPAICEGACTLGVNREPVSIKEIELNIIEKAFKEGWIKPNLPKVRTGKKVAVIGSGPSGLSTASELNSVGHSVTVFEREDEIGGLLRYGIPDFKLEKHILDRRINIMKEEGVEFRTNIYAGRGKYSADELIKNFDAVVLTGGSTIPRDLKIQGRELKGIHFAVDFLKQQNKRVAGKKLIEEEINAKGKVVVVIGGGDTGSDCIGTSIRQGAKAVYQYELMPRQPLVRDETMPWPTFPRTLKVTTSHEEGCIREWCISTEKFEGKDGWVKSLQGVKVKWQKENGRRKMTKIPGTEFNQKVDMVLLAMGFLHPKHEGLLDDMGVEFDASGNVKTDENYMTSKKGIFAAGDMRRGQSLVVWALKEGRKAARQVDRYLMGETSLRG
ncbi:glutamate synthase subunit beta [Clostridium luticellarii]|jgi:glutamate synthase (NADPH/NADH) small chain|uniref:Glutamate synthase [NADPH] small chain n=1 Tax=Clostridium luticellarii TaxID=1691940 RepID=A0A2T0BLN2_9CLOT|nr:glutamate synthase subunit beta [Clostridium luticellarii]MCI1945472.1 glutamate synthase subunit beta [Clostridium luticellarii]MCI1968805.1 glutamate synthase subunit beta [Clostridium luticellarii]MCI1995858.1 glutamate synthase subunit beta [Clostridium luticellarii]MCI2040284.1 glutamate synthase subunit beta [Clostridium luticellarii]PRR84804.1 Glutamate synthase [NADPH] small chain [Clostridium luticellarii]